MSMTTHFGLDANSTEDQIVSNALGNPKGTLTFVGISKSYANGSGADQANVSSSFKDVLAPSGSTNHTLSDGSMKNVLKDGVTFTSIKSWAVKNTGANPLKLSGTFFDISTEEIGLLPGETIGKGGSSDGKTITPASNDVVSIASILGTSYELFFAGVGTLN